jgi:hypothetical protein
LLLVPAGLLHQWQDELREKGALVVPLWENNELFWPDGKSQKKIEAKDALAKCDVLLLSREWARLESNRTILLSAPAWDLTLLDEAHAARRKYPKENDFNSANLLLGLLRDLQLRQQTRGILLMSATPMQTQPWEPWDLLSTLGIGSDWIVDFNYVREYYDDIKKVRMGGLNLALSKELAGLIASDDEFPVPPTKPYPRNERELFDKLGFIPPQDRSLYANWLRKSSPLGRRMHRNTRETLKRYFEKGMLPLPPPRRELHDIIFDYEDALERKVYEAIRAYIDERYSQLEKEKSGKGFVMTVYRRRAASSPLALRRSLLRRKNRLERFVEKVSIEPWLTPQEEDFDPSDLGDDDNDKIDPGLPARPELAKSEIQKIDELLGMLEQLGTQDSKLTKFSTVLEQAKNDGRAVLVFTEYVDTLEYLRSQLHPTYEHTIGCYSGRGGELWENNAWKKVPKAEITERLFKGSLKILVCTDAASEGLNLQAAGALVNYDLPWNPSRVEQRIGRIDRIGQTNLVIPIYNLFLTESVDIRVYQVLRERCGLFEHFVGRMQPVLSMAHNAFTKVMSKEEEALFLQELRQRATEVEQDATISAAYEGADVDQFKSKTPPVTRKDLLVGLDWLGRVGGKIRVKQRSINCWEIKGIGKIFSVTTDCSELEKDDTVQPLSIGSLTVTAIRDSLPLPTRTPLIIVEKAKGPFCCSEVRWIKGKEIVPVGTASQLSELIKSWDGTLVAPDLIMSAKKQAEEAIWPRLFNMEFQVEFQTSLGLERQLESATLRLRRELGRTLRCFGIGELNDYFRKQIRQETKEDGRYHQALRRFGNYPIWSADEVKDFETYVNKLSEAQLSGRISLASELDAALNDPRWTAECIRPPHRVNLNLSLDMSFDSSSENIEKQFISPLAEVLKTDINRIKILRIVKGSVIVPLEMDENDATKLYMLYTNGDPTLKTLPLFSILGIIPSNKIKIEVLTMLSETSDQPIDLKGSLERQLRNRKRAILKLQEKRTEHIDPRNVPLDITEAEKYQQEEIAKLEFQLKELGVDPTAI